MPEAVFGALAIVWTRVRSATPAPEVCGVGCGGRCWPGAETVSPLNIRGLAATSRCADRLAAAVGLPVAVDNDAKALALGEGWLGAAAGCRRLPGHGGVDRHRRRHRARRPPARRRRGNAGHIGHVVVEPDGRPCVCGGRGCLEAEASGPVHRGGDRAARRPRPPTRSVAATGTLVGRAVASVANLLDLELAVVAGSVALGFGRPVLRCRPGGDRATGPARLLAVDPDHPGRAGCRRPAGRCGGRRAPGPSPLGRRRRRDRAR